MGMIKVYLYVLSSHSFEVQIGNWKIKGRGKPRKRKGNKFFSWAPGPKSPFSAQLGKPAHGHRAWTFCSAPSSVARAPIADPSLMLARHFLCYIAAWEPFATDRWDQPVSSFLFADRQNRMPLRPAPLGEARSWRNLWNPLGGASSCSRATEHAVHRAGRIGLVRPTQADFTHL
jgi:hypothetical protein